MSHACTCTYTCKLTLTEQTSIMYAGPALTLAHVHRPLDLTVSETDAAAVMTQAVC